MRLKNWDFILAGFLEQRRFVPFAWGVNDCCLFACDGIKAITGVDPADGTFRGKYRTAIGAHRLLNAHGGIEDGFYRTCFEKHGITELPTPKLARRGDVVLIDTENGQALGIMDSVNAFFVGKNGLIPMGIEKCRRAWRVE